MDEKQLRKLAGLSLNEAAILEFKLKQGPEIVIKFDTVERAFGKVANAEREVTFHTFKVKSKGPKGPVITPENVDKIDRDDEKTANKKLKEITNLTKRFKDDVKKVLEK